MAEKKSKSEVDYAKGRLGDRCGVCEHFIPTNACELVAGEIAPDMWCRLFAKRGKPDRAAA